MYQLSEIDAFLENHPTLEARFESLAKAQNFPLTFTFQAIKEQLCWATNEKEIVPTIHRLHILAQLHLHDTPPDVAGTEVSDNPVVTYVDETTLHALTLATIAAFNATSGSINNTEGFKLHTIQY